MPEFLNLIPPPQALQQWLEHISPLVESERIASSEALGRVTAEALLAAEALPAFDRSAMDGYAVRAKDTHGAGEASPVYLSQVGEVNMGERPDFNIQSGECALIHTGGMLPNGADAVVMLEYCQASRPGEVEVARACAEGEHVIAEGEDLSPGDLILPRGSRLRPAEIGGLMALGFTEISVLRRPKIGILSTGDEVIPPEQDPALGQVRDVNSYSLASLVEGHGAQAKRYGIFSDDEKFLHKRAAEALEACDALLISAGSSASARDLTADLVNALGEPGVLVHGINLRPGKPTILGICAGKAIVGLPGNPASALVVAWLFVRPMLDRLSGISVAPSQLLRRARLTVNLPSQSGREDWVAVKLIKQDGELLAEPVYGRSNLIFTLVRADGLLRIEAQSNGLAAGAEVDVHLLT